MKGVKYIIEGRRWFDKINGNTYHTIAITSTKDNKLIYESPFTYGYDDQYRQTALDYLIKENILKESDRFNHDLIRQTLYFNVVDVTRKRDL